MYRPLPTSGSRPVPASSVRSGRDVNVGRSASRYRPVSLFSYRTGMTAEEITTEYPAVTGGTFHTLDRPLS